MMHYWLVKTEPEVYSWGDLVKEKRTAWTGIRNFAARKHLRAMTKGDQVFLYYSMSKQAGIIGIAEVIKSAYQDPTTSEDWSCVDLKPVKPLPSPVSLQIIKQTAALKQMALVRIGRLSVQPVTQLEWKTILRLSKAVAANKIR